MVSTIGALDSGCLATRPTSKSHQETARPYKGLGFGGLNLGFRELWGFRVLVSMGGLGKPKQQLALLHGFEGL